MGVSSNGKTAGLHPANEGSTPSTVHLLADALVVKGTSWLPPKEQVQVRLLAGVLIASMVKGTSHGSAKAEFLVRIQVEALWPGPRQGTGALNLGRAGSTPALAA